MADHGASDPILLTEDLLEQLQARWRQQGMPIAESLRPGLSDAEMDELTQPLGVRLPREARTWWRWHDGADAGSANLGPGRVFAPLADAVRNTLSVREIMRGVDGELDPMWRPSWLTMNSGGDTTVIDCGGSFGEPVPARYYRFEEPETGATGVPSIGTLVTLYINAFDRGAWAYDAGRRVWCGDPSKPDPATRNLHLT
jgi:cell wall assembly regulator SMI1